jgi:toluene monooxygenase system ferredoxin subunit
MATVARTFLCKLGDVEPDTVKQVALAGDQSICVINAGGDFYACQARCPHQGVALAEGCVDGTTLICLEHLWQWDIRSGEPSGLAEKPLAMFPIEIDGDSVFLKS